jgi:hypothetical protein
MGQFACPGDVPICYGGQADLEQKRWRQSSKMMLLSRHPSRHTKEDI